MLCNWLDPTFRGNLLFQISVVLNPRQIEFEKVIKHFVQGKNTIFFYNALRGNVKKSQYIILLIKLTLKIERFLKSLRKRRLNFKHI